MPITSVDVIVAGGDPVAGIENARVRRSIDEAMVLPFPCRSFARGAWITARVFRRRSRAAGSFWRRMPQVLSFGAAIRPAVRALRVHTSVIAICASTIGRRNGALHRDTTPRSTRSWRRVVRTGEAAHAFVEIVV